MKEYQISQSILLYDIQILPINKKKRKKKKKIRRKFIPTSQIDKTGLSLNRESHILARDKLIPVYPFTLVPISPIKVIPKGRATVSSPVYFDRSLRFYRFPLFLHLYSISMLFFFIRFDLVAIYVNNTIFRALRLKFPENNYNFDFDFDFDVSMRSSGLYLEIIYARELPWNHVLQQV